MREDMIELARLESKVDQFMLSQDRHNESVVRNLEKLTDAMAKQQAQQVEINQISQSVQTLASKHDSFGARLGTIESSQAVSSEFRKEITHLKWVCIGAAVSLSVGVIVMVTRTIISA
tara:strand:+ start:138 stop:491 length:354 start_codon:yes stop_codon:yes gene_type:complete